MNVFRSLEVEKSRHDTCRPILYLACNVCPQCSIYGATTVCTNFEDFDRLTNAEELLTRCLGGGWKWALVQFVVYDVIGDPACLACKIVSVLHPVFRECRLAKLTNMLQISEHEDQKFS